MKPLWGKFLLTVTSICLLMVLLLTTIQWAALDRGFYSRQYQKNQADLATGLSLGDLDKVTDQLLDYLSGKASDLEMQYPVSGVEREIFDSREKTHMVDVQALFLFVMQLRNLALGLVLACGAGGWLLLKQDAPRWAAMLYRRALAGFFAVAVGLGALFACNFNWFWNHFHLLLFTNDLWLLDPAVSIMINMFPLEFFLSICLRILVVMVALSGLLGLAATVLLRKTGRETVTL